MPNDIETVKKMFGSQVKLGEQSEMQVSSLITILNNKMMDLIKFVNTELIATQSTGLNY